MTVSSPYVSLRGIRNEFAAGTTYASLRSFRRGGPSGYVRANQGDNPATNLAAGVSATTQVSMRSFRNAGRGWTWTNSGNLYNAAMQSYFGSDWYVDYPKTFTNNSQLLSSAPGQWGFRVDGGAGARSLVNNGNILGAGGASESASGSSALYINSTGIGVWNNSQIFAGGGGGGHGGTGGTGGGGQYGYTDRQPDSGEYYDGSYSTRAIPGGAHGITQVYWGGLIYNAYAPPYHPITQSGWTYQTATVRYNDGNSIYWGVYRTAPATAYTNGGGGGGGGTGGRGYGSDGGNAGGSGGAPGAGGGTNAGSGGYGGTGGTGGSWGAYGGTGATGATGGAGNRTGGYAGGGGTGGGPPGYYIYAQSSWAFYVNASAAGLYYSVV